MLDPRNPFHTLLGIVLFRMPHNQRRWRNYLGRFLPILENVFPYNDAARLLVMKTLKQIDANNVEGAQKTLQRLSPTFYHGSNEEKALWHILHALYQHKSGHLDKMSGNLRAARKYGHRFYSAYMMHADFFIAHHHYDEAEENLLQAIDCIYAFPPVSEASQKIIGEQYAQIATLRTFMHHYDEAKAAIRLAEQMHVPISDLLYCQSLLNAALHLPTEAEYCLSQLQEINAQSADKIRQHVQLILEDKHPHFTAQPIGTPEGIAAFWQEFLANEQELQRLIDNGNIQQARDLMSAPLRAMDPYQDDHWAYNIRFRDNAYTLTFANLHSRTYTPWIDAILAACPPEVHKRWRIIRKP